jgi:hypothetical protein
VADFGLDEVFSDDITVLAMDGYPLAATLFLPRGTKRHPERKPEHFGALRQILGSRPQVPPRAK